MTFNDIHIHIIGHCSTKNEDIWDHLDVRKKAPSGSSRSNIPSEISCRSTKYRRGTKREQTRTGIDLAFAGRSTPLFATRQRCRSCPGLSSKATAKGRNGWQELKRRTSSRFKQSIHGRLLRLQRVGSLSKMVPGRCVVVLLFELAKAQECLFGNITGSWER